MALDIGAILQIIKVGTSLIDGVSGIIEDVQAGRATEEEANARVGVIAARAKAYHWEPVTPPAEPEDPEPGPV